KMLLDSLLLDYSTEGILSGKWLAGGDDASDFQIQAALRLLYYYPTETATLIAARLRSFDVRRADPNAEVTRDAKNGVDTIAFIKAVSWCSAPAVQQALADI